MKNLFKSILRMSSCVSYKHESPVESRATTHASALSCVHFNGSIFTQINPSLIKLILP